MPETVIEQFLRTGTANITQELLDNLTAIVRGYVTGLFDALRAHGYDARLIKLFVIGGCGCLVKHFGKYDPGVVIFVDDLHASAKGYEYMAQGWSGTGSALPESPVIGVVCEGYHRAISSVTPN